MKACLAVTLLSIVVAACNMDSRPGGDPDATIGPATPDAEVIASVPDATPVPLPPDAAALPPDGGFAIDLACSLEELQPILTCAQENCLSDLTATCITVNCGLLVLGLSPDCRDCFITGIAGGDSATTAAACGVDLGGLGG